MYPAAIFPSIGISGCPGRLLNETIKGGAWHRYLQPIYLLSNESEVVAVNLWFTTLD
jgi:hypothetical protein